MGYFTFTLFFTFTKKQCKALYFKSKKKTFFLFGLRCCMGILHNRVFILPVINLASFRNGILLLVDVTTVVSKH